MNLAPNTKDTSKLTIIAFGDSITEGTHGGANIKDTFPVVLEKMLLQKQICIKVINKGVPGETAPESLFRLERDVIRLNPDMVLVMYGANDAYIPPGKKTPAVNRVDYSMAIRKIVRRLIDMSIHPVLMTTTPVLDLDASPYYTESSYEKIKQSLESHIIEMRKIAYEEKILLIDHYKTWIELDKDRDILKAYLPDGVHPNADGNYLLAIVTYQALINEIRK